MKRYLSVLIVAAIIGYFCSHAASCEDGVVSESDEEPNESTLYSTTVTVDEHTEGTFYESGITPCCTQGQTGVDNAHYVFVSTMDGKISALDVTNGGKVVWSSDSFSDGLPLLRSSLSSTQINMNDLPYSLVPSLDGSLYVYSYSDGMLQPLALNANLLLQSSKMLGNDAVAGGKLVTVTGVDPLTGIVRYRCGSEGCYQAKDASGGRSVSLVMQHVRNTVRGVDASYGHERWNLSVSEYNFSLSPRSDALSIAPEKSHIDFRLSVADGIVSAYNSCDRRVWSQDLQSPIAKVYELFSGTLNEISLFDHKNVETSLYSHESADEKSEIYSHVYFGTVNHCPYVIPSPYAREELKKLTNTEEEDNYQPSSLSQLSQNQQVSVLTGEESIANIITNAYENSLKIFMNSCPSKEPYAVATSGSEEVENGLLVARHPEGNKGWFILKERLSDYSAIEDQSSTNIGRREAKECLSQDQPKEKISRRKQFKETIQKAFNTDEQVSGLWRLMALMLLLTFFCTGCSGCVYWFRSKQKSLVSTTDDLQSHVSSTTVNDEGKSMEVQDSMPGKLTKDISSSAPSTPIESVAVADHLTYVSKFLQDFDPVKCLGRGGFGVVFECLNKLDECSYAVKRIAVSDSKTAKERVRREVRAMAKLDHPGIIRYYHTWIEHPPKGWQRNMDQKILSEMSIESSLVDSSFLDQSSVKPSAIIRVSKKSRNSTLFGEEEDLDDTWNASFANDTESASSDSSDPGFDDVFEGAISSAQITNACTTECSEGIVFDSEAASGDAKPISQMEDGPLVPPVVLVATETSLQTSKSTKNYVYMYIQMELCQRETLHEWLLNNQQRDIAKMRWWFKELVDAIAYIHSQSLIHRDLKPQNIFFASTGRLKVGDLGLATQSLDCKGASDADSVLPASIFHTGNVGTRTYMSPEQLAGKSYNSKVDVFSLGLIFCELMSPFGTVMERIEVLQGLQKGCVSNLLSSLPDDDLNFIKWLTRMDPEQRPPCDEILASEYLPAK